MSDERVPSESQAFNERAIAGPRLSDRQWRICVDFGTAASKACLALQGDWAGDAGRRVKPLPIGQAAGAAEALLTPSAIFIEDGKIFFGPHALKRAAQNNSDREPLLSFKMLLGAPDLPDLLEAAVKRNVDPSGTLRNKHILTFYMAYLGALIETCLAHDSDFATIKGEVRWRYSRPEWPAAIAGEHDRITLALFEKALEIAARLRPEFLSGEGIPIDHALQVFETAQPRALRFEGGVLEAHAAAAAHAGAAKLASSFVLVFDIGAGTTDFAAFELTHTPDGFFQMREVAAARRSITLAGDEIDSILMNAFLTKARLKKDVLAQSELWRSLKKTIRELKHQAFKDERCEVRFRDKVVPIQRAELTNQPRFKEFVRVIQENFTEALSATTAEAKAAKVKTVSVILAGGGSSLPFIQKLARHTARTWRKDARVVVEPMAPLWANAPEFNGALAPIFPQLEIAIGGASPLIRVAQAQHAA